MKQSLLVFIMLFFVCSCFCEKDGRHTKTQMIRVAQDFDPAVKFKLGKSITDVIPCIDYGSSCISVHRMLVRKVTMVAVEFKTENDARLVAKRLNQYYWKNWVFDDVMGEPVLEDFIVKAYNVKKPVDDSKKDTKNQ